MGVKTISACVLSLAAALIAFAGDDPAATAKAPSTTTAASAKTSAKTPADPGKKATVSKTATSKTGSSKVAASASSSKKAVSKRPAKSAATVRQSAQQQPTPGRYKEIQQALADKGYFKGAVDGNWSADSVDALKRFQHEQNLPEDGKIGSLSLIALGLGPKHDAGTEVPSVAGSATPTGVDKNTPQ